MSVADVLNAAADLLTPEGAWTQGESGRAIDGTPRPLAIEDDACSWCILGAVARAEGHPHGPASEFLAKQFGPDPEDNWLPAAAVWNDAPGRTQAEVVAKLREAAAQATGSTLTGRSS